MYTNVNVITPSVEFCVLFAHCDNTWSVVQKAQEVMVMFDRYRSETDDKTAMRQFVDYLEYDGGGVDPLDIWDSIAYLGKHHDAANVPEFGMVSFTPVCMRSAKAAAKYHVALDYRKGIVLNDAFLFCEGLSPWDVEDLDIVQETPMDKFLHDSERFLKGKTSTRYIKANGGYAKTIA